MEDDKIKKKAKLLAAGFGTNSGEDGGRVEVEGVKQGAHTSLGLRLVGCLAKREEEEESEVS